jgi:hypothetical protein
MLVLVAPLLIPTLVVPEEIASFPMRPADPLYGIVECNGVKLPAAFDSGAVFSALDESMIQMLDLREDDSRVTLPGIRWFKPPRIRIGASECNVDRVAVVDLSSGSRSSGEPLKAIVGMDVLSSFVLEMNSDESLFRLWKKMSYCAKGRTPPRIIICGWRPSTHCC